MIWTHIHLIAVYDMEIIVFHLWTSYGKTEIGNVTLLELIDITVAFN